MKIYNITIYVNGFNIFLKLRGIKFNIINTFHFILIMLITPLLLVENSISTGFFGC